MSRRRRLARLLPATVGVLLAIIGPQQTQANDALPTVASIELQRYTGQWFEIARLPMWFERNCIGDISATYSLRDDQRINVRNRCRTKDGVISATGVAEVPDPTYPGQLRVRFAPAWLSWLPLVWGDYWILELDPQYRWVMVGAPSRDYLWILSRTPSLEQPQIDALKQKAKALGFRVDAMIDVQNEAP